MVQGHLANAVLCLAVLSGCSCFANASAFLGRVPDQAGVQPVNQEAERAFLAILEEELGTEHRRATEGRLGRIESTLKPIVTALPKNAHGRLGHVAVRYAMHRLFLQQHAWFVRGLEPEGGAWNGSSPTTVFQGRVPEYVQSVFEKRLGDRGVDLHELAVLVATLENLVHEETMQRLRHTYRALERSTEDPLSPEEAIEVADAYMMSYIMGLNFTTLTPATIKTKHARILDVYPTWPETQRFVREAQTAAVSPRDEYTFENMASVVEEIGERYGQWQDIECRGLKKELVAMEDRSTGRVRLSDFYGSAIHEGKWYFSETVTYLRQLGALDESDPENVRVIISNYIMSPTNCVASSSYYTVCCLDACEGILSHVEEQLGTHDATPSEILSSIALLPSSVVPENRAVSNALEGRLHDVAQHHGGRIPLHGRLFAQWMHQAYPRECPYPHITGTTYPQRAPEYIKKTGQRVTASSDEMRQHVSASPRRVEVDAAPTEEDYGMWTMEEELIVYHEAPVSTKPRAILAGWVRGLVVAALSMSFVLVLVQACGSALHAAGNAAVPKSKYHV